MATPALATSPIYRITLDDIEGNAHRMQEFAGRVLLVVNTASKCGFTPQYKGLESLHEKYSPEGLSVLGFPCNQFGAQEPGTAAEIKQFCELNYRVQFPLFAKVDVNGRSAHPLFRHLTSEKRGVFGTSAIKWNFTKFLIDRSGKVIARYGPRTGPTALEPTIQQLLAAR